MNKCPCGTEKDYSTCCGRFIEGNALPEVPEELMRSRYTAYTRGEMDYIEATMRGEALDGFDKKASGDWARSLKWVGLEVLDAPPVSEGETVGIVEFEARFKVSGRMETMRERSEFQRVDGRWFYISGS